MVLIRRTGCRPPTAGKSGFFQRYEDPSPIYGPTFCRYRPPITTSPLIIAFDGDCLLCSRTIRFLADHDAGEHLQFTRLQDPLGREMSAAAGGPPLDSILVRQDGEVLSHSDAILAILRRLESPWKQIAGPAQLIPRRLRDALYRFIAARRYAWFGKGDACAMPNEALSKRLLPPGT